ncbi:hypothetical protein [Streptomyces javensis]|uniref:Holin n=1 Tax=Streptomyces javensis TaxID=114698 RepID=A0ABS0R5P9_9ACTN|nr:hypothetical protein [Streptomyces javensis]MBI0312710.1 hypothetical protein [Streptomyces javensis]
MHRALWRYFIPSLVGLLVSGSELMRRTSLGASDTIAAAAWGIITAGLLAWRLGDGPQKPR